MDNPDVAKAEEKPKETEDEYMERMIRDMDDEDKRREEELAKIKAQKCANKQAQEKNSTSVGGKDEKDTVTTGGTDGTYQQQLDVVPAAGTFLELLPQADGAGDMVTSANPTDPVIGLRIHRPNASRDELDDEALELMQILRDCIFKTSELTGYLAGHPDVIRPCRYDISMLDATSSFLASMMGPVSYGSVRPTAEQIWRRTEIRNRHYRLINRMRRIPGEQEEVAGAGLGGPVAVQEEEQAQVQVEGSGQGGHDASQKNSML